MGKAVQNAVRNAEGGGGGSDENADGMGTVESKIECFRVDIHIAQEASAEIVGFSSLCCEGSHHVITRVPRSNFPVSNEETPSLSSKDSDSPLLLVLFFSSCSRPHV